MPSQADELVGTLRGFIDQPDYPTLVLGGEDGEMAFPSATLQSFSQQDEDDYYLLYPDPCPSAAVYMDAIAKSLATQREAYNIGLKDQGLEPWPPLPLEVEDGRYPPARRLVALAKYVGEHLPPGPIVWGLLPGELKDLEGYKAMIAPLLCPETVEPWMDRHRFIVRDRKPELAIITELYQKKNDRVLVMELDFSNERTERDLNATALDKTLPPNDRMFAFFQLAAIDFAFLRLPQALEKFGACFNYFKGAGNKPLAALSLKGAGDTMHRAGQPREHSSSTNRASRSRWKTPTWSRSSRTCTARAPRRWSSSAPTTPRATSSTRARVPASSQTRTPSATPWKKRAKRSGSSASSNKPKRPGRTVKTSPSSSTTANARSRSSIA
ncbi:MAG: hypothetical protein M3020_08855 [Myxococcota bacterium]|nr:hypothetical protein [Myxococcota bacterium]